MNIDWTALMDKYYDEIVQTASEMIQIPSTSGEEGQLGKYTVEKMKLLGYDEVNVDQFGNVIGVLGGELVVENQLC